MTKIDHATLATDRNDDATTARMFALGYSIRHIETWHRDGHDDSTIVWNTLSEDDLPY